jgi:adenylosuccinate lyase
MEAEEIPPIEDIVQGLKLHAVPQEEIDEILANASHGAAHRILQAKDDERRDSAVATSAELGLPRESINLLFDKGFVWVQYEELNSALELPDETFEERWAKRDNLELRLQLGEGPEITDGRYNRYVRPFRAISSEQALVRGRMKFAVEYIIALADRLGGDSNYEALVPRAFTRDEKEGLRSIYQEFRTKDYLAAKTIEKKTKHDIVAANTWVTVRAQEIMGKNLKGEEKDTFLKMMRGLVHFARTSADVNTTVCGELYMDALAQWTGALKSLVGELETRAEEYAHMSCVGETHNQAAQLTTLGHIYANLAEQIRQKAELLLGQNILRIESTISGAIGTDVDMKAALPGFEPSGMYSDIVMDQFGLDYVPYGKDQDITNASIGRMFNTMIDVGEVIEKAAMDIWLYSGRGVLVKKTEKGESGSSAMPQKANPWLAEGAEFLQSYIRHGIPEIKKALSAFRLQGDLRRSLAKREGFHPIMLSIISIKRLIGEIKKYDANPAGMEMAIYEQGPKILSSAVSTYLRAQGVEDAYDTLKGVVMRPYVRPGDVLDCVQEMHMSESINLEQADEIRGMLYSVMDNEGHMDKIRQARTSEEMAEVLDALVERNMDVRSRCRVIGEAVENTGVMVMRAKETQELLERYENYHEVN